METKKPRNGDTGYAREVRAERWLNLTASFWLAAIALLVAGWLVVAALRQTGFRIP